jgi:hypothetical protein
VPGSERRRGRGVPRGWLVVGCGAATGAVVLVAWLPLGALLTQRAAISAAETHLAQLNAEGATLASQVKQLAQPQYQLQLFRARYQLVEPGQRLIEVLHVSAATNSSANSPYQGDPGFTPIVNPITGSAADPQTTASRSTSTSPSSGGFFSRVLGTLEFWR